MQLRRNHVRLGRIHDIFISHLHGDHIFGLYGMLSTLNLTGRKNPLRIYAPVQFETILRSHLSDFDINLEFEIDFIPLSGNDPLTIMDNGRITVTSIPLKHRVPAYGFIFREKQRDLNIRKEMIKRYNIPLVKIKSIKKGEDFILPDGAVVPNAELTIMPPAPRSYAYCSDTSYFSRLATMVKGVDLLYHEATFAADKTELAHTTGHSTAGEAARTALEAGAGKLVIGHFSARYKEPDILLEEARAIFPETVAAEDGMTIAI